MTLQLALLLAYLNLKYPKAARAIELDTKIFAHSGEPTHGGAREENDRGKQHNDSNAS